ncbi:hypothetical protein ILYODFUR_000232 [Ilyodon furcidens]|uniref:Uncharacterized protein n=1 Tax=Ilyodon furcidens TaxID=33524 RepID=A0ABV0TUU4_9TELE
MTPNGLRLVIIVTQSLISISKSVSRCKHLQQPAILSYNFPQSLKAPHSQKPIHTEGFQMYDHIRIEGVALPPRGGNFWNHFCQETNTTQLLRQQSVAFTGPPGEMGFL